MKRSNGTGCIYKLPGNRRKPWAARVTAGFDENFKQIYKPPKTFRTKKEAECGLLELLGKPIIPKENITLKALYDEFKAIKYPTLIKHTEDTYKSVWKYFKPLEREKVKDIRTNHIQKLVDDCPHGRRTKALIKQLAKMILDYALQHDIVNKNYAIFVVLPKAEKSKGDRFSDIEVVKIEKGYEKGTPFSDLVMVFIYTGFRIGELLGIFKINVDIENMLIVGGIKTDAGKDRTVPIHPKIQDIIREWYNNNTDYLYSIRGKHPSTDSIRDNYYKALEQIGVRRLTPHKCRHTFGSILHNSGVDPKTIQELIGHSDYSMTANIYTHPDIAKLRKGIEAM